jgi:hypothetical protein
MAKKVSIVFEETKPESGGMGFNVYLEGADLEALKNLPRDQWPTAEFWAISCFSIVREALVASGAYRADGELPKGN